MTTVLEPVTFDAPLLNPAPGGLFPATLWHDASGPLRWLMSGLEVRPFNYGFSGGFGVWTADWCAAEADLTDDDVKAAGDRPTPLAPFLGITTWASDECDMRPESRPEVRLRAEQIHRLREPNAVEAAFGDRLLDDAGTPDTADDIVGAVGHLEELFSDANTMGFIHARPAWAAAAAQANLIRTNAGGRLTTPLGHQWVFGGGYKVPLGDTLVATSQPFGWRGDVHVKDGVPSTYDGFQAIVERSLLIGYEASVGAVTVTG